MGRGVLVLGGPHGWGLGWIGMLLFCFEDEGMGGRGGVLIGSF